jgi:YVTN family beta-propeller protein
LTLTISVAIAVLVLAPSSALAGAPGPHGILPLSRPSAPKEYTSAVSNHNDSLTLSHNGELNIFGMANGGNSSSTGFTGGEYVTAADSKGFIAAALAVTQASSDKYNTSDRRYSIGGVDITGFSYYGEKAKTLIPPVQAASKLTETFTLAESAYVVIFALSGGQNSISLQGIPKFSVDANGTGPGWAGVMIGHAKLTAGSYTVLEETTNHDSGGTNRADVVGVFAFSNSKAGFIDKQLSVRVTSTVSVSSTQLVYDPARGEIFTDSGSGVVSVISDSTNTVTAKVDVGSGAAGLAYDSAKGEIFVANEKSDNVSVISDSTNLVVATVPVGTNPISAAYDNVTGEVYVANYQSDNVSVINDTNDTVVATVAVGLQPEGLTFDSGTDQIIVPDYNDYYSQSGLGADIISDVTNPVVGMLGTPSFPVDALYDSGQREIWIVGTGVAVFSNSSHSPIAAFGVGPKPNGLAIDPAKNEVFVTTSDTKGATLAIVSDTTFSLEATVSLGYATAVVYDSGKAEIFVSTGGEVAIIPVARGPLGS